MSQPNGGLNSVCLPTQLMRTPITQLMASITGTSQLLVCGAASTTHLLIGGLVGLTVQPNSHR